jgi:hypothetical protein
MGSVGICIYEVHLSATTARHGAGGMGKLRSKDLVGMRP